MSYIQNSFDKIAEGRNLLGLLGIIFIMKKIILTGGGTGGHVYPNIALIPDLNDAGFQVVYVGGKGDTLEKRLCTELGVEYHGLPTIKLVRGLSLKGIVNNLKIPFVLMHSVADGRKLLKALQPDLIFAKGGYVSLPMVLSHGKIPLICHESDLTLGLANKIGKVMGGQVLTSNPKTQGEFVGVPVRRELFQVNPLEARKKLNLSPHDRVLLVVGGSSGAKPLNDALMLKLPILTKKYVVIHLYGKAPFNPPKRTDRYIPIQYADNMGELYAVSDVVISRAGATAVAELSALEKRALFIPLPKGVSRGDQLDNAVYAKTLGGRVLYESELKGLVREIDKTLSLPPMTKPSCDTNGKIVEIIRDSISRGDLCKNKKL